MWRAVNKSTCDVWSRNLATWAFSGVFTFGRPHHMTWLWRWLCFEILPSIPLQLPYFETVSTYWQLPGWLMGKTRELGDEKKTLTASWGNQKPAKCVEAIKKPPLATYGGQSKASVGNQETPLLCNWSAHTHENNWWKRQKASPLIFNPQNHCSPKKSFLRSFAKGFPVNVPPPTITLHACVLAAPCGGTYCGGGR